ncbi:hypothetical protein [Amycolatopsis sp. NBC_01286]|uniref:hypothetical protein n=1 Tax=Amycolatopsis sp. NBC_01286 TaxID=2903560 RepID=UPI002E0EB4DA|nr:hypothetical protein OG570_48160 [Amycolatopsis sp. NBC_01286]
MNRELPADETTGPDDQANVTSLTDRMGRFSTHLGGTTFPRLTLPGDRSSHVRVEQIIAATQVNDFYRMQVERKVKATAGLLVLALALFLFAVFSPTPQPWALVALGVVLTCAVGRARQAGALGLYRRREVRAVLHDVTRSAA